MRTKQLFVIAFAMSLTSFSHAQDKKVIPLWPEGPAESNKIEAAESTTDNRIRDVSVPTVTVYPADSSKNTGTAILVCPGGGYGRLAWEHEGTQFGEWLSSNGITCFLLKYRMPNKHSWIPLRDAQQAMRIIRSRAAEWGIQSDRIGVSGFSAGGHLASTLGTHFDTGTPLPTAPVPVKKGKKAVVQPEPARPLSSYSCRPDFMILFYPVITMQESFTHMGSRQNLLGNAYKKDSVDYYSNELQVTGNTPPALLFLSDDDGAVPPENSVRFYQALKQNNIPAAMYIYPEGGHGWGFRNTFRYHESWKGLYMEWLRKMKFI